MGQEDNAASFSELFDELITNMSCSLVSEKQKILLRPGSRARKLYQKDWILEKYNCSYSFNERHRDEFEDQHLRTVGTSPDGDMRIIELSAHRFFLAMLFQPQLHNEAASHPIIAAFLKAAQESRREE